MKNFADLTNQFHRAASMYQTLKVDAPKVLRLMDSVQISLHCWQSDDVTGFEKGDGIPGGGLAVTGSYPGKARNIEEVRQDLVFVLSLIPGHHKINLHAIYGDFSAGLVDRDKISIEQFRTWIDWAREHKVGLDFNATCFGHPKAADGLTLSHRDPTIRKFWVKHVQQCRSIANDIGQELGQVCVHNLWIPDSSKDQTVDRLLYREHLLDSLDKIYSKSYSTDHMLDAVESKLFGIGGESMTVGSHEFYLAYALKNNLMLCLDNGHFHPTESVADKIPALLPFFNRLLLHMTRGIRWDSDHVVTQNDEIQAIAQEVVRADAMNRVHLALDYFDASINRIGAYVIGVRAVQRAFVHALLEPLTLLRKYESKGMNFERLALLEEMKAMPEHAIYNYYCMLDEKPIGDEFIKRVQDYEKNVLSKRI